MAKLMIYGAAGYTRRMATARHYRTARTWRGGKPIAITRRLKARHDGSLARAILETVNGYSFTPRAAAEAARRVLAGEMRPVFQTPVDLFGAGFAQTIADTQIRHL